MRIIGLDPGLRHMGWGIIDSHGPKMVHIANGTCNSKGKDLAHRLTSLFDQLSEIITKYAPDQAAVEQVFVNKDGANSLKLGQARAVCLLVPARAGLPVAEYAPNRVKKTIVGAGHAEKTQVARMLQMQLGKVEFASADAADAVAIALCHAHFGGMENKLSEKLGAA